MHWEKTVRELAESSQISENLAKHITTLTQLLEELSIERAGEECIQLLGELPVLSKKALEEGDDSVLKEIEDRLQELEGDQIREFLRIYTTFFHLINSLEQHEISRINREREFDETPEKPRNESILEAVHRMKEAGYSLEQALNVFETMDIQPTITAHPTEARRRSILTKQHEISEMLSCLGNERHTTEEIKYIHNWLLSLVIPRFEIEGG